MPDTSIQDDLTALSIYPNTAPYLGQVATRCIAPTGSIAAATATWAMSRTMHIARDTIVNPKVIFPNFCLNASYVEQVVGAGTIKAAIEYPAGTFTLCNEGTTAFPNGLTTLTFNISIPRGAKFWLRALQVNSNGVIYGARLNFGSMDPTDGLVYGLNTPSDFTTSGTVPRSFQGKQFYGPIAILSMTRRRSVLILGTSLEAGINDGYSDLSSDVGTAARLIGPLVGYINLSIASSLLAGYMSATRTYQDQLFQYVSDVINFHGVNDIQSGGDSVATLVARRTALAALYPTKRVVGGTLTPIVSYSGLTSVSISALSKANSTSTVATATVASTTGLVTGQTVNITGVTGSANTPYNGPKVITVISGTQFTYVIPSENTIATTAPGTITYNDNFSTTTGQVIGTNGLTVKAFNDAARAGITGEQALIDLSDAADPFRTSKWPVSRNPADTVGTPMFATNDGLHQTTGMLELMRDRAMPQAIAVFHS